MPSHVYLRLTGLGATLTPYAPFRISCLDRGGRQLRVESGPRKAVLDFTRGTLEAVPEVVDVVPSRMEGPWHLETTVYQVPWPLNYDIVSTTDPSSPAGYDLERPDASLIYVQGPFRQRPLVSSLAVSGQTVRSTGRHGVHEWIRLAYEHEGTPWEQAHVIVQLQSSTVLAVTMQARQAHAQETFAAACALAEGMRLPTRAA